MSKFKDTRRLLSTWDDVIGSSLFGDEGVVTADDFWLPMAAQTIRAALEAGEAADRSGEQTLAILQALLALDMADMRTWARLDPADEAEELTLACLVMQRNGVDARTSKRCCAALALLGRHWTNQLQQVRHLVRVRTARLADDFADFVPADSLKGLGIRDPDEIVRSWAEAALGVPPRWSDASREFATKMGLGTSDLEQIAHHLDRSVERLDAVVEVFMDEFCRGCDPTVHPKCVDEAKDAGLDVTCPLLEPK